ncbi:MAG: TerD family protein [Clostridiales bacterium]|nr:TerD family protein [Clostridiales bacterium]MDY2729704.1 TerD family protein [Clostridium sp.]
MINVPNKVKGALDLGSSGNMNVSNTSAFNNQGMNMNSYNNENQYGNSNGFNNSDMNNYNNQQAFNNNQNNYNPNMNNNYNAPNNNINMQQNNFNNGQNNFNNMQSNNNFNNGANFNNQSPNMNQNSGGGVILSKGQKISLSKMNPNLDLVDICLGWDVSTNAYDLDSEAFLLGPNERVIGDDWFVFYNQTCSPDGSVRHSGDNTTGAGDGDDEIISIKLSQVNPQVEKIVFVVTINEAKQRNLNFAGVSNAFIRVVDKAQNRELVRFNLTEYYKEVTSMMVGELYKKNNEWRFNPIGNGTNDDLLGLCQRYGVNVAG